MSKTERPYLSYLLRLWRAGTGETWTWQASAENAHTGERRGFASLGLLFAFLEDETEGVLDEQALSAGSEPSNRGDEGRP